MITMLVIVKWYSILWLLSYVPAMAVVAKYAGPAAVHEILFAPISKGPEIVYQRMLHA
jgi:hypothetical protein